MKTKEEIKTKSKVRKVTKKVVNTPEKIVKASGSQLKGFVDFIKTQGVAGVAVGLVLGGAVNVTVRSLVDNVVMPPLGLILGSAEGLKGLTWTIGTVSGKTAVISYGAFLGDLFNFLVIAFVFYFFVIKLLHIDNFEKKKN